MYGANPQQNLAVIVFNQPCTKRSDKAIQHFATPPVAQKQQIFSRISSNPQSNFPTHNTLWERASTFFVLKQGTRHKSL